MTSTPDTTSSPAADDGPALAGATGELGPLPAKRSRARSSLGVALEWALLIGGALLIALLIKAFLFQAFYIPSESMVPTLQKNDRVLVNKLSYKLHAVHRGDIVVFKAPKGPDGQPIDPTVKDLVKRVIGLPGDIVEARDGQVYINGKLLNEPYLPPGTRTDCASFVNPCFLPGPIPPDHYWVMGDNRSESKDSRYFKAIPKSDIIGRAFIRIWPLNRLDLL